MFPILPLIFIAAGAYFTSACANEEHPSDSEPPRNLPPEESLPVDFVETGFAGPNLEEEVRGDLAKLFQAGLSLKDIDGGYYLYGRQIHAEEKRVGAGDGKLAELEIYQAARDQYQKNPSQPLFKEIIQSYPKRAAYHYNAASNCFGVTHCAPEYDEAVDKNFIRALGMDPGMAGVLVYLAHSSHYQGDLATSYFLYQQALLPDSKISPEQREDVEQSFFQVLLPITEEVLKEIHDSPSGLSEAKLEWVEQAARSGLEIAARYATHPAILGGNWVDDFHNRLGQILKFRKKDGEAREHFLEAIKLYEKDEMMRKSPTMVNLHLAMARIELSTKNTQEARKHLHISQKIYAMMSGARKEEVDLAEMKNLQKEIRK
jgi:tetratricopeptide (TPR) repeat protein